MKKLVLALLLMIAIVGCTKSKPNYKKLETEFTELAEKYYNEQLKDKVLGVNQHQVTLEHLEIADYDISSFTAKSCDRTSYSLVKLQLDEDRNVVGNYEIENHLICGDYKTAEANK